MKSYKEVRETYEECTGLLKLASAITAPLDRGARRSLSRAKEAAITLGWVLGYGPERVARDIRPETEEVGAGSPQERGQR